MKPDIRYAIKGDIIKGEDGELHQKMIPLTRKGIGLVKNYSFNKVYTLTPKVKTENKQVVINA